MAQPDLIGWRRGFSRGLSLLLALMALLIYGPQMVAQDCAFQLGFKTLHDLIPAVVGECLENERHDPATGLTRQATTNGQLTWQKADNWTGFTDGVHTWVHGPEGLQKRLNSDRFEWETSAPDLLVRRLTRQQLLNAEYRLPLLGDHDTRIRLNNGEGSIADPEEPDVRAYAGIVEGAIEFGDLDGDGFADAAVVAYTSGGGSGTFIHVIAVLDRSGQPAQAARAFLGDRVRTRGMAVAGGLIAIDSVVHRPGDGLCCPTLDVTRTYVLRGDRLAPRQSLVIEAPHPGEPVASGALIRGTVSTTLGAGGLRYLVYDARGGVIGMGSIPVSANWGTEYPAAFAAPIAFFAGRTEPGRVELIAANLVDGSMPDRTRVPVILQGAPLDDGRLRREPTPELVLEQPASGAVVVGTLELRGRISSLPFEKNLSYRIYDSGGAVVAESYITVEGEYGGEGVFSKSIDLGSIDGPGHLRVEVREESPVDGALIASATVEVYFVGGR